MDVDFRREDGAGLAPPEAPDERERAIGAFRPVAIGPRDLGVDRGHPCAAARARRPDELQQPPIGGQVESSPHGDLGLLVDGLDRTVFGAPNRSP
jgi:hypothetical protein